MNAKLRLMASVVCSFGFMLAAAAALAQPPTAKPDHTALAPGALKWMPAPPVLPRGVQVAVLYGNPFAEGASIIRLKIPPHTMFAPHWHPTAESFTVLEGPFFVGTGDKADKASAAAMPAMSFVSLPALHHHYAYTGDKGAVIDLSFYGPFQITYVNPADDPSRHAMKH
jgi:hypothetical protein